MAERLTILRALLPQCTVDAPRLQTLVTSLVAIKCLHRHPNGNYTLSPNTSKFLVQSSRQYYGDYLRCDCLRGQMR